MRHTVARHLPRLLVLSLAMTLTILVLPAGTALGSTYSPGEIATAEEQVLQEVNQIRTRRGQVALRMADSVRRVAGARSNSMADLNYFGHVSPNGSDASDLMRRAGIRHTFWGEAIGWTVYMPVDDAVPWMVDWWRQSPSHFALLTSNSYNYVGVGVVADGPKLLFTIVFMKGPDQTPPFADVVDADAPDWGASLLRASTNPVTLRWTGRDRPLVTGTSGLAGFNVQRRLSDGTWKLILWRTTKRQVTLDLPSGEHSFRVRARDHRGNRSAWSEATVVVD